MYVFLSSQYEFWDETLATAGLRGGVPPFGAGPAAEEFEAQPNALVLCFKFSGDKSVFLLVGVFFICFIRMCVFLGSQ